MRPTCQPSCKRSQWVASSACITAIRLTCCMPVQRLPLPSALRTAGCGPCVDGSNNYAALAGLMFCFAAVNTVFSKVCRANIAAEYMPSTSTSPSRGCDRRSAPMASLILWASTNAVLYWQQRSRLICTMDRPLAPFTIRQMAASKSVKDILRLAKMVPDVTEN